MITWIFVFSAVALGQGNAGSVGFHSQETCVSYARGFMSRPQTKGVRTAECIGLRNGKVIDFTKQGVIKPVFTTPLPASTPRKVLL